MAIVNRDLDVSEQVETLTVNLGAATIAGATRLLWAAPYPVTIRNVKLGVLGSSGSPILSFFNQRFIAGSGATSLTIGVSGAVGTAIGTSGLQGFSGLAVAGSTLLNLAQGDVLMLALTGANSAFSECLVEVVVKRLQDIRSSYADVIT